MCGVVQRQARQDSCPAANSRTSNASRASSGAHEHLKCEGPKVCVVSSYANFVVMGSAASRKRVALRCPAFVTFVGGGYNGSLARTFAQRKQSQQRQQHQQSQQQSSHTFEARGTTSRLGNSNVNVVVVGSASISQQLAARSSVQPSCSLRGCDHASLARTIVLGSQAIF